MRKALRFVSVAATLVVAATLALRADVNADADLQYQLGSLLFEETRYREALDQHVPDETWRLNATGITQHFFYFFDLVDPMLVDRWLDDHHHEHHDATRAELSQVFERAAEWARSLGTPAVLGEGYMWTPLHSTFEQGPVGKALFELAVEEAVRNDFWGLTLSCTCAPHHPFWSDVAWQRKWNDRFLAS
jgi:hypothetical protein